MNIEAKRTRKKKGKGEKGREIEEDFEEVEGWRYDDTVDAMEGDDLANMRVGGGGG